MVFNIRHCEKDVRLRAQRGKAIQSCSSSRGLHSRPWRSRNSFKNWIATSPSAPRNDVFFYFTIALLLHAGLLFIFMFSISNTKSPQQKTFIKTYVHYAPETVTAKPVITQQQILKTTRHASNISSASNTKAIKPTQQKHERTILKLLHEAIAAKQTYPESALELGQRGTVTIGFMLYPDGQLKNIAILKTSGYSSIDASALASVKAISPVNAIASYLPAPDFFTVDIVFE